MPRSQRTVLHAFVIAASLLLTACGASETVTETTTVQAPVASVPADDTEAKQLAAEKRADERAAEERAEKRAAARRAAAKKRSAERAAAKKRSAKRAAARKRAEEEQASADCITVPNVVGRDHQLAQDTMQGAGLFLLDEEDGSGEDRLLLYDRNWTTVQQNPAAGECVSEDTTVLLTALKDSEL